MKELIKPNQDENSYENESVKALCGELQSCTGFACSSGQSADMDDDDILF